jgi:hypothetical protein
MDIFEKIKVFRKKVGDVVYPKKRKFWLVDVINKYIAMLIVNDLTQLVTAAALILIGFGVDYLFESTGMFIVGLVGGIWLVLIGVIYVLVGFYNMFKMLFS